MDLRLIKVSPSDSEGILADDEVVRDIICQVDSSGSPSHSDLLDLDDSFGGLHFTLTGEYPIPKNEAIKGGMKWYDDSLENVLMGGAPTPYGDSLSCARYLNSEEVAQISKYLLDVSVEKFREDYSSDELEEVEIFPGYWDKDGEWLIGYFKKLTEFYKAALAEGKGILIYAV
jgi:hypothetical protein